MLSQSAVALSSFFLQPFNACTNLVIFRGKEPRIPPLLIRRVLVNQKNITDIALNEISYRPLEPNEARLQLENFAVTANNVTYAATGFALGYWKFFPTGVEGQGLVPVWGVAKVTESTSEALSPGTRLYGFYPMAEQLVIQPGVMSNGTVVDEAQNRANLPAIYNRYTPVHEGTPTEDHLRALLQPLLATSFLLFDWLQDNDWFGAGQIVIGSASSKTGLGLAEFLAELGDRPYRIVGLTSDGNRAFVEGLGAYDQVFSYNQITQLQALPTVYVDMAGNAEVKLRLHTHLGENVVRSSAVGTSHWDKFGQPKLMPGAKPKFFFAPTQAQKRRDEWGPGVIEGQINNGWKRIAEKASNWLKICEHRGLNSTPDVYRNVARGLASPNEGHVIVLGD